MLKDLITIAATYLKLDAVNDYLALLEEQSLSQTQANQDDVLIDQEPENETAVPQEIKLLTNLANLVLRQIVREYMPLFVEEELISNENCQIEYSKFKNSVNQVVGVGFKDHISSTFRVFPEYIKVGYPNEKYIVLYSYFPPELKNLTDNVVCPMGLSHEVIALGICAEYCLVNSLFDEADMWETKFANSLSNASRRLKERKLPSRGWI